MYMNRIILNNESYRVTEDDLPYLVIYGDKSGGSHFTVTLIADLFSSGSKILFFTAFPMAKDNFLGQIGQGYSKIGFVNSKDDLESYKDSDVIILDSGNESLFIEAIKMLPNINERVILVKNIEAFSNEIFDTCLDLNNIILSGNIDMCIAKDRIVKKSFKTTVVFTKPEIPLSIEVPKLDKWTGYLSSQGHSGMIKVQIN